MVNSAMSQNATKQKLFLMSTAFGSACRACRGRAVCGASRYKCGNLTHGCFDWINEPSIKVLDDPRSKCLNHAIIQSTCFMKMMNQVFTHEIDVQRLWHKCMKGLERIFRDRLKRTSQLLHKVSKAHWYPCFCLLSEAEAV